MPPVSIPYTLAPGARAPTRATPGAAGMDLHAHLPDGARVSIPPGEWAHIPTGVSVAIPAGYEGQIRPRSGLAWKRGVAVLNSPGTIDSDYRGEVGVLLVNHGDVECTIYDGDRIAQLVIAPAPAVELVAADSLPPTARGAGGFGSTGTGPPLPDSWKHDSGATVTAPAPATVPVVLHRRSSDAARAYHEGYAAALRSVAGWLRDRAAVCDDIAGKHGVVGGWLGDCTTDADDDRARMEARIRALEAEVSEARAEAAQWAAELDGERAAVVAYLRQSASVADEFGAVADALTAEADAIERGEHRAGGAR